MTAPDKIKDQTYFLSHMSVNQLQRCFFPIGDMSKQDVRAYAQQHDLATKNRKDSQGICFLGKLKFRDFVAAHLGEQVGNIVETETGDILGEHQGYWFYTKGQRQGLGLAGGPWYVVHKNIVQNIVYVSRDYFSHNKKRDQFYVENINLINSSL
jgi:tRNA-specific 2-thiouridylase